MPMFMVCCKAPIAFKFFRSISRFAGFRGPGEFSRDRKEEREKSMFRGGSIPPGVFMRR